MLRIKVGHDVDYYTDAVRVKGRDAYYTDASADGEPPGLWYGRGAAALGLSGEVDAEIMKALYTHGLDPRDPATASRETWGKAARFGKAPRNYKSAEEIYAGLLDQHPDAGPEERAELRGQAARSARQSVGFYDMVLSASKSQTLLWAGCERGAAEAAAAGNEEAAAQWRHVAGLVEESMMMGHRAAMDYLAEHASYARAGHHGGGAGQWVDAPDLVCAQFLQHDSRDHDPQLHVHGTILNKVLCSDGTVRALDYSLFLQHRDAAAAHGERAAEAHLWASTGAFWETRLDGTARELAGADPDASGLFSKRTATITPTLAGMISQFRAETGRAPTRTEQSGLAERAGAVTRQAKVLGAETREGQLARWAQEYDAAFGRRLSAMASNMLGKAPEQPAMWSERDVVSRALAEMEDSRQSWTRSNLTLAVSNALPGHLGIATAQVGPLLEGLTDKAEALARHLNPRTGPEGLDAKYYRADGESVFVKPHAARYATPTQILGEGELRAAAVRRGAPTWTAGDADEVIARFARAGRELGVDQAAALRGILTSGAAVEVLNAPAGTGKSFLVGTLADTWPLTGAFPTGHPGGGAGPEADPGLGTGDGPRVFGLAYGQRQADVLAEEGVTARNIRRWLDGQQRLDDGHATADDETFRLRSGDLLVVDEAGAAATPDLVAIHRRAQAAGAKLLLVGDHKQLAAVGAGGALADISERGISYELAEVRRFTHGWEASASLRLRDGDTSVAAEYAKHGRIVDAGTVEQAEQAAARAWLADTIAGRDALLVVGSNQAAARVSNQLRGDLVRLGHVQEGGVPLAAPGWAGTVAGVGDLIQARRNAWHLEGWRGNIEAPINRQTYRVTATGSDGGLTVARVLGRDDNGSEQLAALLQLPASYVRERVTLAYACTVHAAHGRTVGHGYGVLAPGTDAAAAYVQATRGRDDNTLFMVTRHVADTAEIGETHTVAARSCTQVLADVIRPPENDLNRTALTEAETAAERARATTTHADPLIAVVADLTAGRTGRWLDRLAATGDLPEDHRVALAADEARTSLDQLLRSAELAGHDPAQVLRDAVTSSSLDGSSSVAQVLHFRIRSALDGKLDPQVASFADLLPRDLAEQDRPGLEALAHAADARRTELGAQVAQAPPQWAREALGPVPDPTDDPAGRAEWEHKAGWAAGYREWADHTDQADPLGAAPPAGLAEKHAVFRTAHTALDLSTAGADEEAMSEGRLRAHVAAWEREQRFAPRYVADELEAAHDALRRARTDATVWAARADAEPDPIEADQLRAAAGDAARRTEELAPVVADLEFADDVRTAWRLETEVTRDKAERARHGAGLRGIDLDNPAERVTAQEWLDADLAERLAADADRAITEHDVDPRHDTDHINADHNVLGDDHRGEDGVVVEPAPPDIRETSVPDVGERADRPQPRRVPLHDEAAATVDRARLALAEIETRKAAEAAETARAAEPEPDHDERREELHRWADHDTAGTDPTTERTESDDELYRER